MSDGLGMRYAFLGPMETTHLNAEGNFHAFLRVRLIDFNFSHFQGFISYCERYSKTIHAVSETMGPTPKMEGPMMEKIAKQLEEMCPLEDLEKRRAWRDSCLTQLSQMKKNVGDWRRF